MRVKTENRRGRNFYKDPFEAENCIPRYKDSLEANLCIAQYKYLKTDGRQGKTGAGSKRLLCR
jgi:hypothetical protein